MKLLHFREVKTANGQSSLEQNKTFYFPYMNKKQTKALHKLWKLLKPNFIFYCSCGEKKQNKTKIGLKYIEYILTQLKLCQYVLIATEKVINYTDDVVTASGYSELESTCESCCTVGQDENKTRNKP